MIRSVVSRSVLAHGSWAFAETAWWTWESRPGGVPGVKPTSSSPSPKPTPSPSGKEFTAVSVPKITGSVKVGKTLTAYPGAWGPGEVEE